MLRWTTYIFSLSLYLALVCNNKNIKSQNALASTKPLNLISKKNTLDYQSYIDIFVITR